MHILFVDESGSPPESDKAHVQPYFVLGGIVIPEDIWAKVASDLARLKSYHHIDGEIKWSSLKNSNSCMSPLDWTGFELV